jgi:hypothetical protein
MTCLRQPAQVAVGDHRLNAATMAAGCVVHGDAEVGQIEGTFGEVSGELHARHPSRHGNSAFEPLSQAGSLNKTKASAFHSTEMTAEALFKTSLNKRSHPWNI